MPETTPYDENNPEHKALLEQHQNLYGENNDTIERIAEKYQVSAPRAGQLALVIEHLIDYLVGPSGTVERILYDIDYEETFKKRLHGVEVKSSGEAFRNKGKGGLHVVQKGGIIKP